MKEKTSWDRFWSPSDNNAHDHAGHVAAQALEDHWDRFFKWSTLNDDPELVLDACCGAGVLSKRFGSFYEEQHRSTPHLVCTDLSSNAVRTANADQNSDGVVADAARPPFRNGSFDLIMSQFGLEYAGQAALRNIPALLKPGGALSIVVHVQNGAIAEECRENAEFTRNILSIGVLQAAKDAIEDMKTQARLNRPGTASIAVRQQLETSVMALRKFISEKGTDIADGLGVNLFNDLGRMFGQLNKYALDDVLHWLEGTSKEVENYVVRMDHMVQSARTQSDIDDVLTAWTSQNVSLESALCGALQNDGKTIAHVLTGRAPT